MDQLYKNRHHRVLLFEVHLLVYNLLHSYKFLLNLLHLLHHHHLRFPKILYLMDYLEMG
tara:strand:- start:225 stop:401 length:177 start_codon:yes stop_codon:yes gene_type:complete